jgi:hypothetical protein
VRRASREAGAVTEGSEGDRCGASRRFPSFPDEGLGNRTFGAIRRLLPQGRVTITFSALRDYAHLPGAVKRLGLHYSRFWALGEDRRPALQSLTPATSLTNKSNPRSRARSGADSIPRTVSVADLLCLGQWVLQLHPRNTASKPRTQVEARGVSCSFQNRNFPSAWVSIPVAGLLRLRSCRPVSFPA